MANSTPKSKLRRPLTTIALAVALVMAGSATVSAQIVEYRGGGFLTNFTQACQQGGWGPGPAYVNARYRPPRLGNNGPSTRLAFYTGHYANSFVLPQGDLTNRFKAVSGGGTGSVTYFFAGRPQMRVTQQTPSTVRRGTAHLRLKGQIRRFDDYPGCRVTFDISLTKRP